MSDIFVTITGVSNYYNLRPYKVGKIVCLKKDFLNPHDECAIRVEVPYIGCVGYVANSPTTVYAGTFSADRIYEKVRDESFARIMFITRSSVIAKLLSDEESIHEIEKLKNTAGGFFEDTENTTSSDSEKKSIFSNLFGDKAK